MESACGNIFRRKNHLASAGDRIEGHTHNFDHLMIVFTGAVHIMTTLADGSRLDQEIVAPGDCLIRYDRQHQITALVADTEVWCIYSHRTAQGDVTESDTGWPDAYL